VLSHFECTWRLSGWALYLRLDHICTYGGRNVGVCTFDSGSPVVSNGQLVGVVGFVIPCALGFPDWGPRVSSYSRWINSHIRHL
jgi:trypsin